MKRYLNVIQNSRKKYQVKIYFKEVKLVFKNIYNINIIFILNDNHIRLSKLNVCTENVHCMHWKIAATQNRFYV